MILGSVVEEALGAVPNGTYSHGRFSNGPVWAEYLADSLELPVENYAHGGACTNGCEARFGLPPSVRRMTENYLARQDAELRESLLVAWAGANDIFNGSASGEAAAANLLASLRALAAKRPKAILVMQLLELSGLARPSEESPGRLSEVASREAGARFNAALETGLDALCAEFPATPIFYAKPRDIVAKTKGYPRTLGITDETTACYTGGVYVFQGGAKKVCANSQEHRFWDGGTKVHCSYAVSSLIALHAAGLADGTATEDEYLERCRTCAL